MYRNALPARQWSQRRTAYRIGTRRVTVILHVLPEAQGQRLDQWLTAQLSAHAPAQEHDHSRAEIQRWIKEGRVAVDGAPAKAGLRLEGGEAVEVDLPGAPAPAPHLQPEAIPLTIVYEDADLLVVDKPAGMVVHPAPGHAGGTLVNAVLAHCPDIEGVGGEQRPGVVHRLDRETSGLIVVAKHDRALRALQAQFKARTVFKEYIALVEGGIHPAEGRIAAPIGRHPNERKRQAILVADPLTGEERGREAITEYHTLGTYYGRVAGTSGLMTFTLLRCVLLTGRTHQIRVHLAWRKHPVVGDTLYGPHKPRLPIGDRHFLHAHRMTLRLPSTGEERAFVAPLPQELEKVLAGLTQ